MGKMKSYVLAKLTDINFKMLIHEGNANTRLASQAERIYLLSSDEIPESHRKQFIELQEKIKTTLENMMEPGLKPVKILGIYNRTASKYLHLLYEIEHLLRE